MKVVPQGLSAPDSSLPASSILLRVCGKQPSDRLQQSLQQNDIIRIGRSVSGEGISIPWDFAISREHADVCWENGFLRVTCIPTARQPITFNGERVREAAVRSGESFTIGTTQFQTASEEIELPLLSETEERLISEILPAPRVLRTYTPLDLQQVPFRDSDQQLEYLSRLPAMISEAASDSELGQTVCGLLMDAIPHAEAAAVAQYDLSDFGESTDGRNFFPKPLMMRVQTRDRFAGAFQPSRKTVTNALRQQESVLHVWRTGDAAHQPTVSEGLGWAICAPIRGESCEGWCIYVAGSRAPEGGRDVTEEDLMADVRFTELVAQFIGSVRNVRSLQEQKVKLNAFFSPKVIDGLTATTGKDALAPAERNITVLFCDVRGFSRKAEEFQDDLFTLLDSVRAALSVMVDGILSRDGAIADFQGDAAMGFWGWPVALEYGPIPACRAAIAIHREFKKQAAVPGSLLDGFSVGIGIAHGRAIAGQIGTVQQSKIGVFGPVVNQCARLETMTKQFGVSICIDQATADFIDRYFSEDDGRLRPLARVRPLGMQSVLEVYNLLPPEHDAPEVSDTMIAIQKDVYANVVAGNWDQAIELLRQLPKEDGPAQFMRHRLAEYNNKPAADWDGSFPLARK